MIFEIFVAFHHKTKTNKQNKNKNKNKKKKQEKKNKNVGISKFVNNDFFKALHHYFYHKMIENIRIKLFQSFQQLFFF